MKTTEVRIVVIQSVIDGSVYSLSKTASAIESVKYSPYKSLDVWEGHMKRDAEQAGNTVLSVLSETVEIAPRRVKVRDQVYTLVTVDPSGRVRTLAITDREAVECGYRDTADYMDKRYLDNHTVVQRFHNEVEYEVEE